MKNNTSTFIEVFVCPSCGKEYVKDGFCMEHPYPSRPRLQSKMRPKRQITDTFRVVDWFASRASGGFILESLSTGEQVPVYMSDLFKFFKGKEIEDITIEETKKGTAYGWRVLSND